MLAGLQQRALPAGAFQQLQERHDGGRKIERGEAKGLRHEIGAKKTWSITSARMPSNT